MQKTVLRWVIRLIGPALFLLFLWRTDIAAIGSALQGVQWLPVVASLMVPLGMVATTLCATSA